MARTRQAKVDGITVPPLEVDDPTGEARVLVLGWGSTYGPITAAVRRVRADGGRVAQAHLRHLKPLPGQPRRGAEGLRAGHRPGAEPRTARSVAARQYLVDAQSYSQVRGLPFKAAQWADVLHAAIGTLDAEESQ
jgi:2-oxoglutarate ferredoxin oxidoreductase subunit alpha